MKINIFGFLLAIGCHFIVSATNLTRTNGINDPEKIADFFSDTVYVRKNVQQQCAAYKELFNRIYHRVMKDIPSDSLSDLIRKMATTNDSGFLPIFEDGILIGRDYVRVRPSLALYKTSLHELTKLWQEAKQHNNAKTLTPMVFVELNIAL